MNGSYLYFRGFKVVANDNTTWSKGVNANNSYNCLKITSSSASSWTNVTQYRLMSGQSNASSNTVLANFSGSGSNYTATVTLSAGTHHLYILDVVNAQDWRNGNPSITRSSNTTNIYNYGSLNNSTSHTIDITADIAGSYTIHFPASNGGVLTVDYPTRTFTATVTNDGHGTPTRSASSVTEGSSVTFTSGTPASGYIFDYWEKVSGTISGSFTSTSSSITVTPTSNITFKAHYKQSKFTVTVQAGTGGSVSPTSFTNLESGGGGTITATPTSGTNYVFTGWSASPAANVTFADSGSATTTFTATGAATITASFTLETVYAVTVINGIDQTSTSVNAGNTVNPTIVAADQDSDEKGFTGWTLTGNVALASGSLTSKTIKVKATGTGGTVKANYSDYVYFYAGVQDNWQGKARVKVGSTELTEFNSYKNTSTSGTYPGGDGSTVIYSDKNSTTFGGNSATWYYTGIFRVTKAAAGTIYVGTNGTWINCGALSTDYQGYGYFVYNTGSADTYKKLSPQRVTALTITGGSTFDADETITFNKEETYYAGSEAKTAGQDSFTYSMYAVNQSTNAETSLGTGWVASGKPEDWGLAAGTYKFKIVTTDATTGKMTNTCLSSNVTINATPNKHTVTSSAGTGATYSTSGSTYKYGSGTATTFTNGTTQIKTGSVMTIKYTLATGYTDTGSTLTVKNASNGNVSVTSHTVSGSTVTIVFTLPDSNCTVTYTPKEITHSINIYRRYYKINGGTTEVESTVYATITGAGIATAATASKSAPSMTGYTFQSWTLPSSGVTLASGDLTKTAAISVRATVDNAVIYMDYKETERTVALQSTNASGTVANYGHITNASGTTITSAKIGRITPFTLKAVNHTGYEFLTWELPTGAVLKSGYSLTDPTIEITATANVTVKAKFQPANYSITSTFDSSQKTAVENAGNSISHTPQGGQQGDSYTITVNLADGYAIDTLKINGTTVTGTLSGSKYTYTSTINGTDVSAVAKLKAKTPTLSDVQVKDNSTTEFPYVSVSNNGSKENYYKQPLDVMATTQSYATLQFSATTNSSPSYTASTSPYTKVQSLTGIAAPTTSNYSTYSASYTVTVRAENAKPGVNTAYSTLYKFTINVKLNEAQKAWFKLKEFYQRDEITEETGAATYYDGGATQIATYNSEYSSTGTKLATEPDYNATNASEYTDQYNALYNALLDMLSYAKTTTFYVLTNVAYSASTPINAHVWREGNVTEPDYNHFKLYAKYINPENKVTTVEDTYHLIYEGSVYYSNTSNYRYLYSFTYAGHTCMNFWKGSSANDTSDSNKITGDFKNINTFGQYYVNVYNTNPGTGSTTSKTDFTDFNITSSPTKSQRLFRLNTEDDPHSYTRKEIINAIGSEGTDSNRTPKLNGSIADDPGVVNNVTSVKVTGPMGKATKSTITLASDSAKWTPNYQGRYQVEYTVKIGVDARNSVGATFEKTLTMDIWVAFDDIAIYVDMNGNVGTPILNFAYTDGGTTAYLPYEMDLVTGSESIYGYTIKCSKLKNDYGIEFVNDMLNIAYITVENKRIGQGTGFNIGVDSTLSGSAWFKADSTNLKTFNAIAYSAVENTFAAQIVGNTTDYLDTGIKNVTGTGIITDDEDTGIFKDLYAGLETGFNKFSYNVRARANEEITYNDNQYYFVKWVEIDTPASGEIDLTDAEDVSDVADLNINIAPVYTDTEGDKTYVALFKPAASGGDVRVQVKYNFRDYDTSDGNYIFDINKSTNAASFTKTITVPLNKTFNGKIYTNFAAVKADVEYIAKTNAPKIQSFYFDYEYVDESAGNITEDTANNKITATAQMNNPPHEYTIVFGSNTYTGHYQNIKTLETSISNPAWYIGTGSNKTLIEVGKSSIDVRYGAALNGSADTIYITVEAASSGQTAGGNASVITNSIQEFYTEGTTKTVKHNFYIVDFCDEGTLLGGGVVYATTDGNGNYRQSSAATNLASTSSITAYINDILAGDYDTEYIDQTIKNVRFRYLPFAGAEDVFRYSDILGGYHYTYPITNKNDASYGAQTLRVYSYFIKSDHTVVVSPTYAEITRYVEE